MPGEVRDQVLIFVATAFAAPVIDAHGSATVTDHAAAGLGAAVGVQSERLEATLGADGLAHGAGLALLAGPRVRAFPGRADATGRVHLILGGGYALGLGEGPYGEGGVGIDLGRGPRPLRLGAAYQRGPGQPGRALFTVGLLGRRPPPTPEPVPPPRFEAAMVWVPGPVCAWLPPDEAALAWQRPDLDPTDATLIPSPTGPTTSATDATPTGDLVVAALPGDRIWIDDDEVTPAADGIAWAPRPEGPVTVQVVGGGRRHGDTVAVAADGTLWYSADPPGDPVRVRFAGGSSQVPDDLDDTLQPLVDDLGHWAVQVWGSASPEGDEAGNEALAMERARGVAAGLEAAGVDPARIEVLPPRPPDPELPVHEQRAAVVQPRLEVL